MLSCIDGIGVSCPNFWTYIWSIDVPTLTSDPSVSFGRTCVNITALDRKWSPPTSDGANASAIRVSVLLMIVRWLRKGSSELRLPLLISKRRPVAAGFQKFCVMPNSLHPAAPCTCSMHTSRVRPAARPAAVFAKTPRAGTIESSNGSAIVAPRPRSAERRDMCFPVRNIESSGS